MTPTVFTGSNWLKSVVQECTRVSGLFSDRQNKQSFNSLFMKYYNHRGLMLTIFRFSHTCANVRTHALWIANEDSNVISVVFACQMELYSTKAIQQIVKNYMGI